MHHLLSLLEDNLRGKVANSNDIESFLANDYILHGTDHKLELDANETLHRIIIKGPHFLAEVL